MMPDIELTNKIYAYGVTAHGFDQMTDSDRILVILSAWNGEWVADLYYRSRAMVHSRIANLRQRGYQIECKRFGPGDYRYRLVGSPK